jgi:iron complex outermembrane receptor protein
MLPPHARAWFLAAAASLPTPALFGQTVAQVTLPEVQVSAPRFPDTERTLPFGVSVITADEIRASGAGNVNEAIMRMLGVPGRVDFYGGGEYSLDLRGFGVTADNNQVVVVDGVRVSEADLGGTRLAGIPIDSVERIEVLRGSGAVLYGEGATGGVIVITTKAGHRPPAAQWRLRLRRAGQLRPARGARQRPRRQRRLRPRHQRAEAQDRRLPGQLGRPTPTAFTTTAQWGGDWLRLGARLVAGRPGLAAAGRAEHGAVRGRPAPGQPSERLGQHPRPAAAPCSPTRPGRLATGLRRGHREKELRSLNAGFAFDYDIDATPTRCGRATKATSAA